MSSVKASVIVAVYNGAKTLTQTIESILSQTYDNFELLLIDDGSTDESKNLIEKYLEDERVKYFKKQNGGVASARNFGIARATGEVIGFSGAWKNFGQITPPEDFIDLDSISDTVSPPNRILFF